MSDLTLRALHGAAAGLHLAQGVYGEVLVNTVFKGRAQFALTNNTVADATRVVSTYNLAQLAPVFSFLSAANHLWAVSDFGGYLHWVDERGYNPVRWLEYSASAGLMYYMVAVMSGVLDLKPLLLLVLSNVALQYTGYSIEKDSAEAIRHGNRLSYETAQRQQVIGFLLFVAQMVCIWTAFGTSVTTSENDVPWLVWLIMAVITALFLAFGLLSLAYTRGFLKHTRTLCERDFRKIEMGYLVLSFVAKTFLMNSVLFGAVQRPDVNSQAGEKNSHQTEKTNVYE